MSTAPTRALAVAAALTIGVFTLSVAAESGNGGAVLIDEGAPTQQSGAQAGGAAADTSENRVVLMRERFVYRAEGRRDPFLSLLTTAELRPALSDLKLNFILFNAQGGSTANMRDNYNQRPVTARVGTQLGRMRVIAIRPNAVIFSIDEFGVNRRDSLLVRPDTTR